MKNGTPTTRGRLLTAAARIWLPAAIAIAGVVLIVLGHASLSTSAGSHPLEAGSGVALLIVALIVWMVNWMFRMSVESNADREREEMAREYFDRHGRWPEEDA
jgi:membrane protein implicated in regulation of membrane protease activity